MNLVLLAVIVGIGIAVIVLSVHLSGGSRQGAFESVFDAIAAFNGDYPESEVLEGRLSQKRDAAFLKLARTDRVGFVQILGMHFVTREIGPADLAADVEVDHAAIRIRARDFTWKGGRFLLDDTATAAEVAAWFPKVGGRVPTGQNGGVRHG